MNHVGKWYITPLGGRMGGHIKWKPEPWGADVEIAQYKESDGLMPTPPDIVYARLPWKALAQILVTRDEV